MVDLFCGAGGASFGYHRAGFNVIGVDIDPQPNYPFEFVQADALEFIEGLLMNTRMNVLENALWLAGTKIVAIHASPPCQAYTTLQKQSGIEYPQLIEPVRELLKRTQLPYVIENVPGAPLEDPITLCGTMFPKLRVIRHRKFETNFPVFTPEHHEHPLVHTFDKRKRQYGQTDEWKDFVQVTGGGNCSKEAAADALGITWMTEKHELNESIPPAYTYHLGKLLLLELGRM